MRVSVCLCLWARVSFLVYQKKFSIFLAFTSNQERDLINTSQVSNPPKHTHTHTHTPIYIHTQNEYRSDTRTELDRPGALGACSSFS